MSLINQLKKFFTKKSDNSDLVTDTTSAADINFNIKVSTTKQLELLIGKEHITAFDAEFLEDTPTALTGLINEFLKMAKDELKEGTVTANEDFSTVSIIANGNMYELKPGNHLDYVSGTRYLKDFNAILESNDYNKRYYYYWDDLDFGQDNGYFYTDKELGTRLINFLKNPPDIHPDEFKNRQGNRIIRIETEDSGGKTTVEYIKKLIADR